MSVEVCANDPRDEERMLDRDLRPILDVWTREDPTLMRGTQPKSKAPCPPLAEQVVKQRKLTVGADENRAGTNGDE